VFREGQSQAYGSLVTWNSDSVGTPAGLHRLNATVPGQVIDVYVSQRRDIASARRFFTAALTVHGDPTEVITDRAPALANVIEELVPAALHNTGQYENNRVECDHGRLKARLRPMRGLKTHRTATVVIRGHDLIQNLRRGHYELAVDSAPLFGLASAFDELRPAI
jgi:IS6 family transposase